MLKLSSSRGIRIYVPVLSVSCSFEDHSVIIQALRKGLIEHEASDTGGVPRWKSSCPDRLAEATRPKQLGNRKLYLASTCFLEVKRRCSHTFHSKTIFFMLKVGTKVQRASNKGHGVSLLVQPSRTLRLWRLGDLR